MDCLSYFMPTKTIEVWADTRGRAQCKACGAGMTWAEVVATGKRMPFTGDPVALTTRHDSATRRLVEVLDLGANHWATCTDPNRFRRKP